MKSLREYEQRLFKAINPAIRFSVRRYVFAIGLFGAVVLFGFVALLGLGVDLLPSVNIPIVAVITNYTGATPSVVDQDVTQVIENSVSNVSGITDINSTSSQGVSRVILIFDPSVDKNAVANQVAAQVSAIVGRLPTNVSPPIVRTFDPNSQPILEFGIYAGAQNLTDVSTWAQNDLTPLLERIDGVANVSLSGAPTRQFQVLLKPDQLAYYGLTPAQVIAAIENYAINQPIGSIITHNNQITFTSQNIPTDTKLISQMLVDPTRGLRVSDVASVRDTSTTNSFARVNGKPVVLVSIQETADANSVAVVNAVRTFLKGYQLPKGYEILYSNDTTTSIRASVDATYHELFITAFVVAFVVLLFLGRLNTAFSVILAIPIALSAAPVLYHFLGYTLNLVSLLALIVAIGIVVDDSIVVAENVERHRALGATRMQAVLRGASEVFSAVAAASLSLLSVLLPVSFLGGFAGRYLQQFSLGLAAAVAFSWFEALLFLTVRMAYTPDSKEVTWPQFARSLVLLPESVRWGFRVWRKPFGIVFGVVIIAVLALIHHPIFIAGMVLYPVVLAIGHYLVRFVLFLLEALTVTLHGWTEAGLEWVRDKYASGLKTVLKVSAWVLIGAGAFFVATLVFIMPHIPFNFVPQSDNGTMMVHIRLPSGTPTAVTNTLTGRAESFLESQPTVQTIQTEVGSSGLFGGSGQANFSSLTVQLVPVNQRPNIFELIPKYRAELLALFKDQPTAQVFISAGGGFRGQGSSVSFDLVSSSFEQLNAQDAKVLQLLQNNKWVSDVSSSLSQTTLENNFVPDPSRIAGTGLDPNSTAQLLAAYTTGTQASTVQVGGQSYPIWVQVDPTYLSSEQSLLNLPIYSPALKQSIEVGQLGTFQLEQAPLSLSRYNRLYTAQYSLDLKPGAPPVLQFQTEVQKELTAAGLLGNGVTLSSGSSFGPAALAGQLSVLGPEIFGVSLLLVYLVMGAQFNSFRFPIYLLLPVPLALTGALWFVYLIGGGLDVFGVMAMLMLIGLSAKNAILYLDFVLDRLGKMPFIDALTDSARLRFRPIVMTTVTVLVISFPLIFGHGEGSEFGRQLGVVMLGGVVFSAILTFFVVPSAFYLFERKRIDQRNLIEKQRAEEIASAGDMGVEETGAAADGRNGHAESGVANSVGRSTEQ